MSQSENIVELPLAGWRLLHSDLPNHALKPIAKGVYGREGLSDIEEAELIRRLHDSLLWTGQTQPVFTLLGTGEQVYNRNDPEKRRTVKTQIWACDWGLEVDGRMWYGRGVHEDEDPDNAIKGAQTGAMKTIAKYLSMDYSVRMDDKIPAPGKGARQDDEPEGPIENPKRGFPKRDGEPVFVEGQECPLCKKGHIRVRTVKSTGNKFLACSAYPACKGSQDIDLSADAVVDGDVDPDDIPF